MDHTSTLIYSPKYPDEDLVDLQIIPVMPSFK